MKSLLKNAFFIVAIVAIASCSNSKKPTNEHQHEMKSEEVKTDTINEVAEHAKYQCPMKCEGDKTYDEPGKCPKCQMDLKEVENI